MDMRPPQPQMNVPQGIGSDGGSTLTDTVRTMGVGTGGGRAAGGVQAGADEHTPISIRLKVKTDVNPPRKTPALFISTPSCNS